MTRVKILYIGTRIYDELIKCQVVRCSKTRSLGVSAKVNAIHIPGVRQINVQVEHLANI